MPNNKKKGIKIDLATFNEQNSSQMDAQALPTALDPILNNKLYGSILIFFIFF